MFPMEGAGNEFLGCIKSREFIKNVSDYQVSNNKWSSAT
jgi:hypothetical protein